MPLINILLVSPTLQKILKIKFLYILICIISISFCYESIILVSNIFKKNVIVESIVSDDTESDDESNENDEYCKLKYDNIYNYFNYQSFFKIGTKHGLFIEPKSLVDYSSILDFPPEKV